MVNEDLDRAVAQVSAIIDGEASQGSAARQSAGSSRQLAPDHLRGSDADQYGAAED